MSAEILLRAAAKMRAETEVAMQPWHPAVALAVADWLGEIGRLASAIPASDMSMPSQGNYVRALGVAHAYLGSES